MSNTENKQPGSTLTGKKPRLPKLPKPFLYSLSKAVFEKKIIARIHVEGEREFARSLYREDETDSEKLILIAYPEKKEKKHLKKLAKEILANRGFVHSGRLIIAAVVVGGIVLSWGLFHNQFLSGILRDSLENTFQARAAVDGFDFDIFGGRIKLESLTVADKDSPMRNLFELGHTELSVDVWQLCNGKVIIRTVESADLRFGSPRSFSGELARHKKAEAKSASAQSSKPAVGLPVSLASFDATALIDREINKLSSLKKAEAAVASFGDVEKKLKDGETLVSTKANTLKDQGASLLVVNPANIGAVLDVQNAEKKIDELKNQANATKNEVQTYGKSLADERTKLESIDREIRESVASDWTYLRGLITTPSVLASDIGSKAAIQVLGPKALEIYNWIQRGPAILSALSDSSADKEPVKARTGRVVVFPVADHPRFQLQRFHGSLILDEGRKLDFLALNISSDPDRSGAPMTFRANYRDNTVDLSASGLIDLRTKATNLLTIDTSLTGLSFALPSNQCPPGFTAIGGVIGAKINFVEAKTGDANLTADGGIYDIQASVDGDGLLQRLAKAAVKAANGSASAKVQIHFPAKSAPEVSVQTDLDKRVASAAQQVLEDEAKRAEQQLREELSKRLDGNLGQITRLVALYRNAESGNLAVLKDVDSNAKALESRRADLDKRLKLLTGTGLPSIPSVPTVPAAPSIPQVPKVQLPGFGR